MLIKQEDNRTPPGFAVVVHHRPFRSLLRLCARCAAANQSCTDFSFLPMPISSLPVMCRSTISNEHAQSTKPA